MSCLVLIVALAQACANGADGDELGNAALSGRGHPAARLFRGRGLRGRHVFRGRGPGHGEGGGTGGAGNTSGAGGSGGAMGGGGSALPPACVGSPPATAAITGSASTPVGGTFTYTSPVLAPPVLTPITSADGVLQGVSVTANPGSTTDPANAWTGFGFAFGAPACLDASEYTGIKFTITGNLGTCRVSFIGIPSEDSAVANAPGVSTCTAATCITPSVGPISTGTTTVHFADLSGGQPLSGLDARALIGVGFQIEAPTDGSPACAASFAVTDVAFINDSPPKACTGQAPAGPLIANFSDAAPSASAPGQFDLPSIGGTYTYAADGVAKPTLSLPSCNGKASGQALSVVAATGVPPASAQYAWSGVGLYFNACTDASAYSGVRFTVKGDLGACPLYFSATFSEDDAIESNPNTGSCVSTAGCYPSWFEPVTTGVNTIAFSSMTSGSPMSTVNPADLTGVHWEFRPPTALTGGTAGACNASFTIDDVTFVP